MYQRAASSYRRGFLNHSLSQELRDGLLAAPDAAAVQQLLFPNFAQFALASFADEISAYRSAICQAHCQTPAAMLCHTDRAMDWGAVGCLVPPTVAADLLSLTHQAHLSVGPADGSLWSAHCTGAS